MAGDIKRTTVLDFYGLPGCGKSTVSRIVSKKLREMGYSVYEPSYVLDHDMGTVRRKLAKLWYYTRFSICHFDRSKKVYRLVRENGYKHFYECLSQCVNIVSKYMALIKADCDYIVFDEGFCQAAVSLSLNGNCKSVVSNYEKIIKICGEDLDLRPVYLKAEIETALENMRIRAGRDSRVDAETDDAKRYEMAHDFYQLCESMERSAFMIQPLRNDERLTAEGILKNIVYK